jgi:hypothetical protein
MSSKSGKGTKSTKSFIASDSPKKVERSEVGFTKHGKKSDGTDGAHIVGWGLYNAVTTHSSGRPLGEDARQQVARDLNSNSNVRIKTEYGNKVLDERRDARTAEAFVHGTPIMTKSGAARAYQQLVSAQQFESLATFAGQLGEIRVYNPETGRTHRLENHGNFTEDEDD